MGQRIRIRTGDVELEAKLNDTKTAGSIAGALPIEAKVQRWGEEIYFEIPVSVEESPDARRDMEVGELAYRPPGNAFCIFFGRTPASTVEAPRAASNVNPVGRILGEATLLTGVEPGSSIFLERG